MEMCMAKSAYEINLYKDYLEYLIPLMSNSSDVNISKIKMWSYCYEQIVNKKCSGLYVLKQENNSGMNDDDWLIFNEYKLGISADIKLICNENILFIDQSDNLMGVITNVNHKALMYQIYGDNHRYKAGVCGDETKLDNYH